MSVSQLQNMEFKTIDGITIRGVFYAVPGPAPVVIMTHGFNCMKEILLPDIAEQFQTLGFNVLIYDPRSIGDSDGVPRNQINPLQQAEDLSDIITHVRDLSQVDSEHVILWGMSFGAVVSACAAAVDRRVSALVMVCPVFSFVQEDKREHALSQIIRDRQSQLRGNKPFRLPMFNTKGENLIGMGGSGGPGGLEAYEFVQAVGNRELRNFEDRVTLQSYQKIALFLPREILHLIKAPVQMIIPELANCSPPDAQEEAFEHIIAPKELHKVKGKGHLTVLSGEGSPKIIQAIANFMRSELGMMTT